MAHGHEDYYSGMVLYGIVSGEMVPINLDAGGNLVALLKAMYGTTPTVLACDADGNLNVNVAVALAAIGVEPKDGTTIFKVTPDGGEAIMKVAEQTPLTTIKVAPTDANPTFKVTPDGGAAIMKVAEQTPLTSIQIEPKSGMGNLKIDINAQTLAVINTYQKKLATGFTIYSEHVTASGESVFLNLIGEGQVNSIYILYEDTAVCPNNYIYMNIDGAELNNVVWHWFFDYNLKGSLGLPLQCVCWDDVLFRYVWTISTPIKFNSLFKLTFKEAYGRNPYIVCRTHYEIK